MLTLRRAAVLLLLLSTLSAQPAQAKWQGGAGFYIGYNSQVIAPNPSDPTSRPGLGALTGALTPFVVWDGEYGRITAYVRLQGEAIGFLFVPLSGVFGAYRGTLITRLDAQLSETRTWSLALSGSGGSFNGGQISTPGGTNDPPPGPSPLQGFNVLATDFVSVDGRSLFSFKETPRFEVSQQTVFRTFIPYGLFTPSASGSITGPSYAVDAQAITSYYWQRFSLGGDLLAGWFLPPPRSGSTVTSAGERSIYNLRVGSRASVDIAPRLSAQIQAGLSVTIGRQEDPVIPDVLRTVAVVNPVGEFSLQKLFTRPEIETALVYSHSASAEVAIGRFSQSDSLSLRAIAPLHPDVSLTAEAAYRYSRGTALTPGPSFHLGQIDTTVRWNFNEYLQLFGRYQFVYQASVGPAAPDQSVRGFNRHVALLGLTFMYPAR